MQTGTWCPCLGVFDSLVWHFRWFTLGRLNFKDYSLLCFPHRRHIGLQGLWEWRILHDIDCCLCDSECRLFFPRHSAHAMPFLELDVGSSEDLRSWCLQYYESIPTCSDRLHLLLGVHHQIHPASVIAHYCWDLSIPWRSFSNHQREECVSLDLLCTHKWHSKFEIVMNGRN